MKDIHSVSVSGGKDSTALLLLMIERGSPIDVVLYADTGIGAHKYPMDLVRKRMESLTYEHVCYVLDNLGRAGPVRNPHGHLLALLFNAPASCNVAVQAVFNANN